MPSALSDPAVTACKKTPRLDFSTQSHPVFSRVCARKPRTILNSRSLPQRASSEKVEETEQRGFQCMTRPHPISPTQLQHRQALRRAAEKISAKVPLHRGWFENIVVFMGFNPSNYSYRAHKDRLFTEPPNHAQYMEETLWSWAEVSRRMVEGDLQIVYARGPDGRVGLGAVPCTDFYICHLEG